ncbi:MAG: glycosyltransferase family 9 protein [Candidatus Hydrogenedentota bacterium]
MDTLIIHTGGIGDFILTCPAVQELTRESSITLAGYVDRLSLAVAGGLARNAVSLDSIDFHSLFAEPSEKLVAFLAPFDRIIVWMRDDDQTIEDTLAEITSASVLVFPGLPPSNWSRHASKYYQQCLGLGELSAFRLASPIEPVVHDVIIHPGSGSRDKNWPLEQYEELADTLEKDGRRVTWCLGPAEEEKGATILPGETLRCETLVELIRHLAGASQYLGNDSGVTHLAAALGVRTVAVFGVTDPGVWAPHGDHVSVAGGSSWPEIVDVLERLR